MSIANGRPARASGIVSGTIDSASPRRAKARPCAWLILVCAAAAAFAGCDATQQTGHGRWQGDAALAPVNDAEWDNPGDSVNEWLYTGDAFEATFIQPTSKHRRWPLSQWREEMANLRHVGFDTVIIQWAEFDEEDFMIPNGDGMSLVERIVVAADEAEVDVYVGLSLREAWYSTQNMSMRFMRGEYARCKRVADWLHPRLKQYEAFRGWYVPHEVCGLSYTSNQRLLVLTFFKQITGYLNEQDPLKAVLASGYTDHDASSLLQFTKWYKMFLEDSGIDVLIFQDGAGLSGRTEWKNILPFADALVTLRKKEFRGDVWLLAEIFTQTAGPPIDGRHFAAEPADFERIREQLDGLGMMGTKLVVYSYFEYMRPSAGEAQASLYDSYRKYIGQKIARISSLSTD